MRNVNIVTNEPDKAGFACFILTMRNVNSAFFDRDVHVANGFILTMRNVNTREHIYGLELL